MRDLDDQLRHALRPLAGDPDAVAAKLREQVAKRPPPRPRPWLVPLITASAGLAAGWLLHALLALPPPAAAAPTSPETPAEPTGAALATVVIENALQVAGADASVLTPVAQGAEIETATGGFGELALQGGALLRLGAETALTMAGPTTISLVTGQLWVRDADHGWTVEQDQGRVVGEPGAEIDVKAESRSLVLTVLAGEADLVASDGTRRRVRAMQSMGVVDGLLGDREHVYWRSQVLAWQTAVLCGPRHYEELGALVKEPLDELSMPSLRPMASAALRDIGHCSVPFLAEFLLSRTGTPETRDAAATLLADLADLGVEDSLLALLADDDAKVRVAAFRALARASGVSRGDETFWSNASLPLRSQMISAWKQALASDR